MKTRNSEKKLDCIAEWVSLEKERERVRERERRRLESPLLESPFLESRFFSLIRVLVKRELKRQS